MPLELSVPGPRALPILGATTHLLRFIADPITYLDRLFGVYGPIAALVRGGSTRLVSTDTHVPGTVFVYGPALNHPLFSEHEVFHKSALSGPLYPSGPLSARTRPLARTLTGLFSVNDAAHKEQRRLLMPAFHKKRIEGYRDEMVLATEALLASFRAGEMRDLRRDMSELTLRIATRTLFGADLGQAGVEVGRDLGRWLELFKYAAAVPWDLPFSPYRRWLDLTHDLDARMLKLVEDKRAAPGGADILSALLEVTDREGASLTLDELIGHAGVLFAAGHETSSNALCWTLALLSQHPAVAADLQDEIESTLRGGAPRLDQLEQLPLLDCVIKESLRLLPPAPLNHRIAACDTELGGCVIPRGTEIISSAYHTHRIPELYPDPHRFVPRRWEQLDPGPYAYSPFGAGPRTCIGKSFAMLELKVVLCMLLSRFRLELLPEQRVDRVITITMRPKYGLPMRVRRPDRKFLAGARGVRGDLRSMVEMS